jgi:catechol 2,3-dioxygenase-like lactoylglutathione lyase family enzyme
MFDHVTIRVSDREASERFYETVLGAIGIADRASDEDYTEWGDFSLAQGGPTTGLHIGFCAWSHEDVDRFWKTGVDAGYESDGEPGMRPEYGDTYYGGFLLDPDGNSIEACLHDGMVRGGNIDHLWIRVPNLDETAAFYDALSPYTGFELRSRPPGRVHFKGAASTFALVDDERPETQNLHVAFATDSNETVDAFHAAALAAGYSDNGRPGERLQYHEGYYGAFVLDPAGANVEVVNHNR